MPALLGGIMLSSRKLIRVLPAAGVLLVGSARLAPLAAQFEATLDPGARVRVTSTHAEGAKLIGTVLSDDRDSLRLSLAEWADPVALPRTSITKLEISQGQHSNVVRGAWIGGAIGAAIGVAVGLLLGSDLPGTPSGYSAGTKAAIGGVFLGVIGLGIGAGIGARTHSERWKEIPRETP